jgi:hypothetical protein
MGDFISTCTTTYRQGLAAFMYEYFDEKYAFDSSPNVLFCGQQNSPIAIE